MRGDGADAAIILSLKPDRTAGTGELGRLRDRLIAQARRIVQQDHKAISFILSKKCAGEHGALARPDAA